MVSAVLISCNERPELERCLKSIKGFVDEIIIVDLHSTDGSEEVFHKFRVKLFRHDRVPYADPIRDWALNKASGDWILMMDPDEELPETLVHRLKIFLSSADAEKYAAINIPFKNIFWGKWISHTNFWPDKHIRFFKKNRVKWISRVHSYPEVSGEILQFPSREEFSINHYGYSSRSEFFRKQLNYAKIDAQNRKSAGESFSIGRFIWLPLREFLARFIKHKGYRDGLDGGFLVLCLMVYRMMVEIYLLKTGK